MVLQNPNINVEPVLTKEQIAHSEAIKNLKLATARLKISQEGVDIDNLPQNHFEEIVKLFDESDAIQRNFNAEAQKLQQDVNSKMQALQEDSNKKLAEIQNRYRILIDIMKSGTKGEYDIKNANITMSKEREEEIRKELKDTLTKSINIRKD